MKEVILNNLVLLLYQVIQIMFNVHIVQENLIQVKQKNILLFVKMLLINQNQYKKKKINKILLIKNNKLIIINNKLNNHKINKYNYQIIIIHNMVKYLN